MKATRASGAWRLWAYLALGLMASCSGTPEAPPHGPGGVVVESVFLDGDHRAERCLSQLAQSFRDLPDGVLFFDPGSRIRVTPPRGPKIESYHLHLFHRVGFGADVLDHVVGQNDAGLIELDLSRFDQPEELVVVSSSYRFSKRGEARALDAAAREEQALAPPYAMAFRLVPSDQSELVMSLQSFRYEVETNLGKLALFVQSFNRRDMLLTWMDPGKKLGSLIQEDPYIHLKKQDAYIPPRVIVDVLRTKGEMPWQRAGTWHLPASSGEVENREARPFSFRIPGRELVAFGPPGRVDFTLPDQPPATSARIEARYSGLRPKDALRLVMAVQIPSGRGGKEPAFKLETREVTAVTGMGAFVADVGDQDPSRFPLTSALAHRLVQPWRLQGGAYRPEPPLGTSTVELGVRAGPAKPHSRVVAPRYASHFDFLTFLGDLRGKSTLGRQFPAPGSPNTNPPPPGGGGGGGGGSGWDDLPPPVPGPAPGPLPGDDRTPGKPLRDGDPRGENVPLSGAAGRGPGAMGGGGETNCGCGAGPAPGLPAPGCPSDRKCKGQCGRGCPANGHCPNDKGGKVYLEFPCPPSPKGCGQDRKAGECKCGMHSWTMNAAMEGITQLFPGAADYSWFGMQSGWAACDQATEIGRVRVSYWAAAGFGQTHVWGTVYAIFGPCMKDPKPGGLGAAGGPGSFGGPRSGPDIAGDKPPGPGSGGGYGGSVVVVGGSPGAPLAASFEGVTTRPWAWAASPAGANDPNTMVHAAIIRESFGIRGGIRLEFFQYDAPTLAQLVQDHGNAIAEAYHAGSRSTVGSSVANANPALDLPLILQGLAELVPALGGGGGGGGGIPPGCGALGIEFVLGVLLVQALLRRLYR